ncbi:hypothetical protein FSP39_023702 [Pinctada imbricata]|uniref:GH16 domain-containing protein n=1 Tax=Pinctada imbricata TaxID=66713 RepID=A0AA88XU60_PINIB|nr:hypothetical protein FSP39_023702 [Pinctada imbricata]
MALLWSLALIVAAVSASKEVFSEVSIHGESGLKIHVPGIFDISSVSAAIKNTDGTIEIHSLEKEGEGWSLVNDDAKVKPGDSLTYKTSAIIDGENIESEWKTVPLNYPLAPVRSLRRTVVFRDDFNSWNPNNPKWNVIVTANQGGTFTKDRFDENFLYHGRMQLTQLWGKCSYGDNWGCDRSAASDILPPIMSGRIRSVPAIRYGRVEVRAKIPQGDWLWPAIWLLPRDNHYGGWPRSGEIDIMESRGNLKVSYGGGNHGINEVSSHLHFGPKWNNNPGPNLAHGEKYSGSWHGWHTYALEWTADHIITYVDNQEIMHIRTPNEGWWNRAHLGGGNIWASGGKNAPFDQPFQLILNVAVGGGFFPDHASYNTPKPWHGGSHPMRDFWEKRGTWMPTWHGEEACMAVDYIEMTQY